MGKGAKGCESVRNDVNKKIKGKESANVISYLNFTSKRILEFTPECTVPPEVTN